MKTRSRILILALIALLPMLSISAQDTDTKEQVKDRPLRIKTKPRPGYTDEARANNVQGMVHLAMTFEADGTIGEVVCVNERNEEWEKLDKFGLVDQAIKAARKIEFDPEIKDGKPITVKKKNSYTFSIY